MSKLDAAGEAPGEQIPEILPLPDEELSEAQETVSGYFPGRIEGAAPPEPVKAARAKPAVATDPLLGEVAAKILYSVDMLQVGAGSGQAAYGSSLSRLRLEPWEVRAARRVQSEDDRAPDAETAANDDLFLEGAALRLRIDEAAQVLKAPSATAEDGKVLEMAAECLVRAQDLDRRFRQSLEAVGTEGPPERLNELTRSRFRLLRAFSGLWLLHNARASAGE